MTIATYQPIRPSFIFYRLTTVIKSIRFLYSLKPDSVQLFLDSYDRDTLDSIQDSSILFNEVKKRELYYHQIINHVAAMGSYEKMYLPPVMNPKLNVVQNQLLFEKKLARDAKMQKECNVLELGCGRGRIACHLAQLTGAKITGINLDSTQIDNARHFAKKNNLSNQCKFLEVDFNDPNLPFTSCSFDIIYNAGAVIGLTTDLEALFRQLFDLLKPGGRFLSLDYVRLKNYDETNPHHLKLMNNLKPLIGALYSRTPEEITALLNKVGFNVLVSEHANNENEFQTSFIEKDKRLYQKILNTIKILTKIRILPMHFKTIFERFMKGADDFIEADQKGLITNSYYFVAQKPTI